MAQLPSGYVVSATGVYGNYPTEKLNGGTALGLTDATSITTGLMTRIFPVRTAASDSIPNRRNLPVAASGTGHTYNAAKTLTSGTFAYEGSGILIRTVSVNINGSANTALLINGNEQHRLRRSLKQNAWGAGTLTAWRNGYFRYLPVAGTRTNWSTAPSALSATFKSTTSNSTDSSDEAQYVTYRSVPGELIYMAGGSGNLPFQDNYKAIYG